MWIVCKLYAWYVRQTCNSNKNEWHFCLYMWHISLYLKSINSGIAKTTLTFNIQTCIQASLYMYTEAYLCMDQIKWNFKADLPFLETLKLSGWWIKQKAYFSGHTSSVFNIQAVWDSGIDFLHKE